LFSAYFLLQPTLHYYHIEREQIAAEREDKAEEEDRSEE
jgi:hypothetical protein